MSKTWESATRFVDIGYAVFPCIPGRKQPLTAGLIVIDVDGPDNPWLADDLDRLEDLARGVVAVTPRGGRHYIFRAPDRLSHRCQTGRIAPRVDVRADGGYILVPPSQVGGKPYRFVEGLELDQPRERLPTPPDWLVAELDRSATSSPTSSRGEQSDGEANPSPAGQRNATLARLECEGEYTRAEEQGDAVGTTVWGRP